jgi:predicted ATPase
MLTELHLSNFKSWRELDMKLGRVTGLFGTNSSGKSSILQFLLMLKQTKDATDTRLVLDLGGQNQLINLGSFKDLIFNHQDNLILKWGLKWKVFDYGEYTDEFKTQVEIILHQKEIKVQLLEYGSLENTQSIKLMDNKYKHSIFFSNKNIITLSFSYPIKTHLIKISIKEIDNSTEPNNIYERVYEILIDAFHYLAPLREYPKREYQWSGASPSHVGYRGENAINAILAATIRNETRTLPNSEEEKPFQEVIAYWLKELGLIHEFAVKEIAEGTGLYRAIVKKSPESPEAFLTDVGFGVSQVLPALVLLYYVPEGSIILMEQPEIHLHPAVQSGLADVILQVSKQRDLQVIVESHSEHLLQRFQRRVAEESYSVDELKLYFCDSKDGESHLIDLEMDEFGDIRNYPANFFGDEMAEIAATHKAALKRKLQAQTQ